MKPHIERRRGPGRPPEGIGGTRVADYPQIAIRVSPALHERFLRGVRHYAAVTNDDRQASFLEHLLRLHEEHRRRSK